MAAFVFHFRKRRRTLRLLQPIACSTLAIGQVTQAESMQLPAQRGIAATLHITAMIAPAVQTAVLVSSSTSWDSIAYNMKAPPVAETCEIRNLPWEERDTRVKGPGGFKDGWRVVAR